MPDLLIELFSEEIPARMQKRAAQDLQKLVTNGLVEAGLTYASAAAFSTPRRLALTVEGMLDASPAVVEERKGPKADAPEKAIEGFLRGAGVSLDDLEERDTPKGKILFAMINKPGRPAAEIVAEVLEHTIRNFPWPKSMRWGSGALKWVRPLHSIVCVMSAEEGAEIVPLEIDGITAGDVTYGHRFLAPDAITVSSFEVYEAKLMRANVVLRAETRAETIWNDAINMAFASGLEVVEDAGLLAEVAGLVEWPVVLMGKIADDFLELPPEVLQTSMREHQKFFSLRNPKTGQIERFITVANRTTSDDGATILAGNEKVLSARLADAKFFWENDLRVATSKDGMAAWVKSLENVTFHNKLGTQAELIERMAVLARELAPMVGADADEAEAAARVAKADLSSEMVYEFPELQGLMGRYYASAAGKSDAVAAACEEHYAPLGPSDDVPVAPVSVAVALAEKIDKLTGFWAIGEKPTGSKDPFALRRAALGVIRILVENGLNFPVVETAIPSMAYLYVQAQFKTGPILEVISNSSRREIDDMEINENVLEKTGILADFYIRDEFDRLVFGEIGAALAAKGLQYEGSFPSLVDQSGFVVEDDEEALAYNDFFGSDTSPITGAADFNERFTESKLNLAARAKEISDIGFVTILARQRVSPFSVINTPLLWDFVSIKVNDLLAFLHDRLKVYLKDQGIRHDIIDACIAMPQNDDLTLLVKRARALSETLKTDDGENLIQGFKRANNILTQAEEADGVEYSYGADVKFSETDEERALFKALDEAEAKITPAMEKQDFTTAMSAMATLRAPVDAFFDAVQVNSDNATVRRNRLNLLSRIRTICTSVADLTKVDG